MSKGKEKAKEPPEPPMTAEDEAASIRLQIAELNERLAELAQPSSDPGDGCPSSSTRPGPSANRALASTRDTARQSLQDRFPSLSAAIQEITRLGGQLRAQQHQGDVDRADIAAVLQLIQVGGTAALFSTLEDHQFPRPPPIPIQQAPEIGHEFPRFGFNLLRHFLGPAIQPQGLPIVDDLSPFQRSVQQLYQSQLATARTRAATQAQALASREGQGASAEAGPSRLPDQGARTGGTRGTGRTGTALDPSSPTPELSPPPSPSANRRPSTRAQPPQPTTSGDDPLQQQEAPSGQTNLDTADPSFRPTLRTLFMARLSYLDDWDRLRRIEGTFTRLVWPLIWRSLYPGYNVELSSLHLNGVSALVEVPGDCLLNSFALMYEQDHIHLWTTDAFTTSTTLWIRFITGSLHEIYPNDSRVRDRPWRGIITLFDPQTGGSWTAPYYTFLRWCEDPFQATLNMPANHPFFLMIQAGMARALGHATAALYLQNRNQLGNGLQHQFDNDVVAFDDVVAAFADFFNIMH